MQNPSNLCPRCGSPIPPDAPGGICPACALLGVADFTKPGQAAAAHTPTLEEVAAAFPELEVLEIIGQGGMGVVFKARQARLDRFVALKILPPVLAAQPGFAERFTREARALARLAHPHIVAVYDFGERAGFCYLMMEYVNGVNLRHAMRAGMSPEQALALVPRVCEALQFAHDRGVLHRDIKPENILLDTTGTPKLADFGIAKLADEPAAVTGLTGTGAQLGTAAYMAPEQIEKPATVDHRADIYSLGVVLYEMLTGELPLGRFAAPSEKSSVGRGVDEAVLRALEKERERRQQSATEMRTEVERAAHSSRDTDPSSPLEEESLIKRILTALTTLSAIGIPASALLPGPPSPSQMVAATIIFATCTGLVDLFIPWPRGKASKTSAAAPVRAKQKDLGLAYVWWFLFGICGGHKFYLGKIGWGFLYFLTCGLFLVGWIYDLFTLPDQVRRHNEAARGLEPSTNAVADPWPRRIFLLIVLLVVMPVVFLMIGLALPRLARKVPLPPTAAAKVATWPESVVTARQSPPIGNLSQGSIELVAVSSHPAGTTRGWQMNGAPLLEGPFVHHAAPGSVEENERAYEFVFRTRGLPADTPLLSWHIEKAPDSAWSGRPELSTEPGRVLPDYTVIIAKLPRDQHTADIRIGAAPGPWETLIQTPPKNAYGEAYQHSLRWKIKHSSPAATEGGGSMVTSTHSRPESWETRVVAVTTEGQEVTANYSRDRSEQTEWRFDQLPRDSIAQIRFQARPIEWVLFRGVALVPTSPDLEK